MTTPDPTAGERWSCGSCGFEGTTQAEWDDHTMSVCPPAVAASTGTSEDVEALAEEVWADEPTEAERDLIRLVLASDWLAAREAAARAEERERIAQAIEGAIEAHRSAGNRSIVAALAPLPDLTREG